MTDTLNEKLFITTVYKNGKKFVFIVKSTRSALSSNLNHAITTVFNEKGLPLPGSYTINSESVKINSVNSVFKMSKILNWCWVN